MLQKIIEQTLIAPRWSLGCWLAVAVILGGCSTAEVEIPAEATAIKQFELGNAAYEDANYSKAVWHYMLSIERDPFREETYYNLGLAYYHMGKYKAAVNSYLKCLEINQEQPATHYNLALAYHKLYQPNLAQQHYQKYLSTVAESSLQLPPNSAGSGNMASNNSLVNGASTNAMATVPTGTTNTSLRSGEATQNNIPTNTEQKWWTQEKFLQGQ